MAKEKTQAVKKTTGRTSRSDSKDTATDKPTPVEGTASKAPATDKTAQAPKETPAPETTTAPVDGSTPTPAPETPKATPEPTPAKEAPKSLLHNEIETIKSNLRTKNSKLDPRTALNFISGVNVALSNDNIDNSKRIQAANELLEALATIKDIEKKAGLVTINWKGDNESKEAYLAVIAMSLAKANGNLDKMPKAGIRNRFFGKFIGMGNIISECS